MIHRIGEQLIFMAPYKTGGVGAPGLTVTVDVRNPNGTLIVSNGVATDHGGGIYRYALSGTNTTTAGPYVATFKTESTSVDQRHVDSAYVVGAPWVQNVDQSLSATAKLAGGRILTVSVAGSNVTAVRFANPPAGDPGVEVGGRLVPITGDNATANGIYVAGYEITAVATSPNFVVTVGSDENGSLMTYVPQVGDQFVYLPPAAWFTGLRASRAWRSASEAGQSLIGSELWKAVSHSAVAAGALATAVPDLFGGEPGITTSDLQWVKIVGSAALFGDQYFTDESPGVYAYVLDGPQAGFVSRTTFFDGPYENEGYATWVGLVDTPPAKIESGTLIFMGAAQYAQAVLSGQIRAALPSAAENAAAVWDKTVVYNDDPSAAESILMETRGYALAANTNAVIAHSAASQAQAAAELAVGLLGGNVVVDSLQYEGTSDRVVSARIRVYQTKAAAEAAGTDGLLATFGSTSTYAGTRLTGERTVREDGMIVIDPGDGGGGPPVQ